MEVYYARPVRRVQKVAAVFSVRECCPACGADARDTVFECSYSADPVRGFLLRYYGIADTPEETRYDTLVEGATYTLQVCRDCALVFQREVPDARTLEIVYDGWIPSSDEDSFTAASARVHFNEALTVTSIVMRAVPGVPVTQLRALDYGMGLGRFAAALKAVGWTVYGMDLSESRQERARANGIHVVDDDDIREQTFHFVNTEQVFEHLPFPQRTAKLLAGQLEPGGILKISVPHSSSIERDDFSIDWSASRYGRNSPTPVHPLEHLQYYKRPAVTKLAAQFGLRPVPITPATRLRAGVDTSSVKGFMRGVGKAFLQSRSKNYHLLQR